VVFTHGHKDHIAGLDDVRAYNFLHTMDMPVYGQSHLLQQLKTEFHYAFEENKYPGIPRLRLIEIDDKPFDVNGVQFTPLPVLHLRMPVLGFRVGDFSYITDANQVPDDTIAKLKGTRVLVLNALQKEKHISHFNLEEAVAMAARIGADQTYFTHISHKLGSHKYVESQLSGPALAYDGLQLTL
jgi:phosphoribosyl 1,2-cyclic phosphate phosphodiesterase